MAERSREPDEPIPGSDAKDSSVRAGLAAALTKIEQAGRGVLVVTDGTKDLRLTVERGAVTLDAKGLTLEAKGSIPAITRALERTLFWENSLLDLDTGTANADKKKHEGLSTLRVAGDAMGAVREIKNQVTEREKLRRKVPSVAVVVEKTATLSDQGTDAAAKLAKVLKDEKRTEVALLDLAQRAGVDEVDAAVGLGDLVDRGQAKIVRRHDPNTAASLLVVALEAVEDGLCPGLRHERAGRLVKEPRAAARLWRSAGELRLAMGRPAEAGDCFSEAVTLVQDDVAAREGQARAFEASGKAKEARRAAEDLGRLYLELGLHGRARNVLSKIPADGLLPPVEEMLVRALAGAGELGKAVDRAEALAPKVDSSARRRLAEMLIAAGAKGVGRDRAVRLGGWDREQRRGRVIGAAGILLGVAGLGILWEGLARRAYAQACVDARQKLSTEAPDEALATTFESVASRYALAPSAASARATAQAVRDLAADDALLEKKGNELVVHNFEDPEVAAKRLAAFESLCRSAGLRQQVHAVVMAFARKRSEIAAKVTELKNLSASGDGLNALDAARKILTDWPGARNQLSGIQIAVRVETQPPGATVYWDDVRVGMSPIEVSLPANGSDCTLKVIANEMKTYERHVAVKSDQRDREIMSPVLRVQLEVDPNAKRPTSSTPKTPPRTRPSIKIAENEAPPPPPREAKPGGSWSVVDNSRDVILRAGLSNAIEVEPSERYFDFLRGQIPERCKITIELVSAIEDDRVVFKGVRVYVDDLLMGRRVAPRMLEVDNCERLVAHVGATLKVFTISRTTNLSQDSFKEKVIDAVRFQCAAVERADQR